MLVFRDTSQKLGALKLISRFCRYSERLIQILFINVEKYFSNWTQRFSLKAPIKRNSSVKFSKNQTYLSEKTMWKTIYFVLSLDPYNAIQDNKKENVRQNLVNKNIVIWREHSRISSTVPNKLMINQNKNICKK